MRTNPAPNRAALNIVFAIATGLSLGSPIYLHGFGAEVVADWDRTQVSHPAETRAVRAGVCDREAETLLEQKPVRIRGSVRAPKKIRDVRPKYPELPAGTIGSGMWIGEALINNSGKVVRVWPIHEVEFTPAFPSFNSAITEAIRHWEFEPLIVQGKPAPVCMTVTVTINWQ